MLARFLSRRSKLHSSVQLRRVTESGAFASKPPLNPPMWPVALIVIIGSKLTYDLLCLKEDWDNLKNAVVEKYQMDVWNSYASPCYRQMIEDGIVSEALGYGAKETGPMQTTSTKNYHFFEYGSIIALSGEKKLSIPMKGPLGEGEFVYVVERMNGKWRKKQAYIQTKDACYLENGKKK
eukprot:TRINITY_DN1260_c2_g2_i1.p1 TRINITY_DN1260_c2_g2~~TRINITY_DN1260_c2_g2_i1.p1  ORF type:complete len:179 (+),score=38.18 TRINITY_DN1260_c2_g2_i1:314-850(+)